jgi:hypothetical protein
MRLPKTACAAAAASAETRRIIRADVGAAAAANVCGTGYNISTGAWREGTYGTTYTWTNGRTTGFSYSDKPICGVLFNDTGAKDSNGRVVVDRVHTVGACDQ